MNRINFIERSTLRVAIIVVINGSKISIHRLIATTLFHYYLYVLVIICRVGDCIVAVNGVSTVNVSHQQAVEALKAAGGVVTLVIIEFFFNLS